MSNNQPVSPRAPVGIHSISFGREGGEAIPLARHVVGGMPQPVPGQPSIDGIEGLPASPTAFDLHEEIQPPQFVEDERNEPFVLLDGDRLSAQVVFRKDGSHDGDPLTIGATGNLSNLTERRVELDFGAAGLSDPVSFASDRPASGGVEDSIWSLAWHVRTEGGVTTLGATEHRVFRVLGRPTSPWGQAPLWVGALELACQWARGATRQTEVAAAITHSLNTHPLIRYHGTTTLGAYTFFLSTFLLLLSREAVFHINCTDCASVIATLGNLLGCDLEERRLFEVNTRPFLKMSGDPTLESDWIERRWIYHEVGWRSGSGPKGQIFDGSLQLDADMNDRDTLRVPRAAADLDLKTYRELLVASGACALGRSGARRPIA